MTHLFSSSLRKHLNYTRRDSLCCFQSLFRNLYGCDPVFEYETKVHNDVAHFISKIKMDDQLFTGNAQPSKKLAKENCVEISIQFLYDKYVNTLKVHSNMILNGTSEENFYELLKYHTYAKFVDLAAPYIDAFSPNTVLAAIYLLDSVNGEVTMVSLASGNKCIRSECIKTDGSTLQDCHAEVLCRRGFKRFLLSQILLFLRDSPNAIFKKDPDSNVMSLKSNFTFHFYISSPPCGAMRQYVSSTNQKNNLGKFRMKLESNPSTVLGTQYAAPETYSAISSGARVKFMSCSDKMMTWNFLGIQGGILCHLIEPIFISSFVIEGLKDTSYFFKTCIERVEKFFSDSNAFKLHKPHVASCKVEKLNSYSHSTNVAINWNVCDDCVEVISISTGLNIFEEKSRLCKKEMGFFFKFICCELGTKFLGKVTYRDLKVTTNYHIVKESFKKWAVENDLGIWHSLPIEFSSFLVN